ncbi:MAG: MBL fold metallo-hydrolase [Lachnospiraceae bacterium]|nr:MBL fold metallo-hydrolase [Lachnospiraceae bacterium]MDY5541311.1 MBL fold metallo-hydrolase [Lachnospiraceae bacterium]MDY5648326.1 MBL fold metallo-hydrolase [Lachnospiraceae bacterium]
MRLCSIASGSSGNCIYVGSDHTHLMVDAGISGKRIEQGLNSLELSAKDMDGILITHEHVDHVKGLGVMARKYALPIYATKGTLDEIRRMGSLGVIPDELYREIHPDEPFAVGDLTVKPMHISHDAADPVAYRVEGEGKSAGIVTDLGKYDDYIVDKIQGLDVLLLEANHDIHMLEVGSYPYPLKRRILGDRGHLSNELSGKLLCRVLHDRMKAVFLGHLSKENNYEELAYETVRLEINLGDTKYQADDFRIEVAKREQRSSVAEF